MKAAEITGISPGKPQQKRSKTLEDWTKSAIPTSNHHFYTSISQNYRTKERTSPPEEQLKP